MSKIRPILHDTFNLGLHLDDAYDTLKVKKAQIPEDKNFQNLAAAINSVPVNNVYSSVEEMEASSNHVDGDIALVKSYGIDKNTLIENVVIPLTTTIKIPKDIMIKVKNFSKSYTFNKEYFYFNDNEEKSIYINDTVESLPELTFSLKGSNSTYHGYRYLDVSLYLSQDQSTISQLIYDIEYDRHGAETDGDVQNVYHIVYDLNNNDTNYFYLELNKTQSTLLGFSDKEQMKINDSIYNGFQTYFSFDEKGSSIVLTGKVNEVLNELDFWDGSGSVRTQMEKELMSNGRSFWVSSLIEPITAQRAEILEGLFLYQQGEWIQLPSQLNTESGDVILFKTFFGKNGSEKGGIDITLSSSDELLKYITLYQKMQKTTYHPDMTDYSYFLRDLNNSTFISEELTKVYPENIINMQGFFYNTNLNSVTFPDWITLQNVQDASKLFKNARNYVSYLNKIPFETMVINQAEEMFKNEDYSPHNDEDGSDFSSVIIAPNFDTTNVTNMSGMFYNCYNLIEVPNYNTSNVKDVSNMFPCCYPLTTVPNFNTINVINMSGMFNDCHQLATVPNFNTINVQDMSSMFQYCYNLIEIPNFNTNNVTNMYAMFSSCNADIIPNFNTSNVKNMDTMFFSYEKPIINLPNFDTSNVETMHQMFTYDTIVQVPNYNTINVKDMTRMFGDCHSSDSYNLILNFNTSNVIDMSFMFDNWETLATVSNLNTINVRSMSSMFSGCSNLIEVPNFNTSNVVSMSSMFSGCSNLIEVPNFDTSNVTDMTYMFYDCYNLITLPLLNMEKVNYTYRFSDNCSNLVNVGGFQNLGKSFNNRNDYFSLTGCPNLSHQSLINIINNLATVSNSYTLYFHNNSLNLLTHAEQKIAINKGWNLPGYVPGISYNYTLLNGYQNEYEYDDVPTITTLRNDLINLNQTSSIVNLSFKYCKELTNFNNLCNNLTHLQNASFMNCENIVDIDNLFYNCNNLVSVNQMNSLGKAFDSTSSINARTLNLTMANLTNTSIVNLFSSLGKPSVEAHINLGNSNLEKLQDTEKSIAARKGWTVDGFEWTPSDFRDFVTINLNSNGGAYGFAEDSDDNGDYYKNTNQGQSSTTSQMSIEITQAAIDKFGTSVTLDCYYSSESVSYDYLLIQKNGTQIGKYGGGGDWLHQEVQISDLQAGDIIYISYRKDGSVDGGQDGVKIYLPIA